MNEIDIVRDISRRFEQADIPYMLTGSMAMNYYAQPRMTRDIDVVVAISPDEVSRAAALFRPDYYVSEENIRESLAHESIFNLIHQESVIKDGLHHSQKQRIPASGVRATPEDRDPRFYDVHREQGRSHYLQTFLGEGFAFRASTRRCYANLLATGYDAAYLQRWTRELGVDNLLNECFE